MKKITNDASLGKIAMLCNILILGMFIVSMVFLLNFDKVNAKLINDTPLYANAESELHEVEKPRRQALADVEYYINKLETLEKQEVPVEKKKAKEHQEEIQKTIQTLANKQEELNKIDAKIKNQIILFEAIKSPFDDLTNQVNAAKLTFKITLWITLFFFVAKAFFFATFNFKGLLNLRATSPWMKKSTSPFWAYVGWLIPVYNFLKPYSVFAEVYNEYNYILLDKKIIEKDIDQNADFNLGLWWSLLLLTTVVISFILNATFFNQGPMYVKFSHSAVTIVAVAFWVVYLSMETMLILRAIKMNQILFANRPIFDHQ